MKESTRKGTGEIGALLRTDDGTEKQIVFDKKYYDSLIQENGYNPLEFEQINFSLGSLKREDLQRKWLCHQDGDTFSKDLQAGKRVTVATGIGLSGVPHIGTLSQILRSITLQKAGVPVQMVLGDLDAYNGKAQPLKNALELVELYESLIVSLGFEQTNGSILRPQYDRPEVLRTAYLIGHFMDDGRFS